MSTRTESARGRSAISNPDRVLFPDSGVTKLQLVEYYRALAPVMLPHLHDRPLVMQRFPEGIDAGGFYEKRVPAWFPSWVPRVTLPLRQGGDLTYVIADSAETLAFLAEQATITLHAWLSRAGDRERPDRMVFDLDPSGDDPEAVYPEVRWAARELHALLDDLDLPAFVTTTGSRGLHVTVPIEPELDFDAVRSFARDVADLLAGRHPDRLTTAQRKAARGDALFLDVLRNGYGQTAVAPYTVRARPGAPIATPLDWGELGRAGMHAQRYTLTNLRRRLAQRHDPWRDIDRQASSLVKAQERFRRLRS